MRFLVVLLLSGCATYHFQLKTGEHVSCKDVLPSSCGLYLGRCENDRTYYCQHSVVEFEERQAAPPLEIEEIRQDKLMFVEGEQ